MTCSNCTNDPGNNSQDLLVHNVKSIDRLCLSWSVLYEHGQENTLSIEEQAFESFDQINFKRRIRIRGLLSLFQENYKDSNLFLFSN